MPGWKKGFILIPAILPVFTGVWRYWSRALPLSEALPDDHWKNIRLLAGDADSEAREWEIPASADAVLSAVAETSVFRTGQRQGLTDSYFQLYLYPETDYPTILYVTSSGKISGSGKWGF